MNATIANAGEFRQCFKCNYDSVTNDRNCPRCGYVMFSALNIRIRGVLLFVGGLFLAGFIGYIGMRLGLHAGTVGDPESVPGFNGDAEMLTVIYVLFVALIGLGLNFGVLGGWMAVFGKRNRVLFRMMWVLYAAVSFAAGAIIYYAG